MRKTLFIAICIISVFLAAEARGVSNPEIAPEVGKFAPEFELKNLKGDNVRLSDFRGKVVLLNFWATWCGPCRAEMPFMEHLYSALKNKGLVVLAISVDKSEKPAKFFATEKKLTLQTLMDTDREVAFDQYAVLGLPTTFLLDKNGLIVEKFMGPVEWDSADVKAKISKLLDGK